MSVNELALYALLGARLREIRHTRGLTQEQLAEAVGILRTSVANIEAGRQKAPLHVLYNLCQELGVELSMILPTCGDVGERLLIAQDMPPKAAAVLERLLRKGD